MKTQRDKLHQYQKRITTITSRETSIARECIARGDKARALLALRRKKFQESLLAKADSQLETLEQLVSDVEFAKLQKDVMFGLSQGVSVLNQIHAEMGGIDSIEKLMGENQEARQYQQEISEMLRGEMSNQDEDEVEDELEALERGMELENGESNGELELPTAPLTQPASSGKEAEDIGSRRARERTRAKERKTAESAEPVLA